MADPYKPGLYATNYLLNYFDKIPNSVFAGDTYRRVIPGVKRRNRRDSIKTPLAAIDSDGVVQPVTIAAMAEPYPTRTYTPDSMYDSGPQYSRAPPRMRPEYLPRNAQDYYPSPAPRSQAGYEGSERSSRRTRDDNDAHYNTSVARRPNGAIRRTSSFNGRDGPKAVTKSNPGPPACQDENKHPSLKEDFLTKSPQGLAAGGVGAIVGAWLSEKAQVKAGREGERGSNHLFLTGLGAVAGGLAANAAVDYYQHKRHMDQHTDQRWEEKFGEPQSAKDRARASSGSRRGRDAPRDRDADQYAKGSRAGSQSVSGRGRGPYQGDSDSVDESEANHGRGRHRGERVVYHGERDGRGYQAYGDGEGDGDDYGR